MARSYLYCYGHHRINPTGVPIESLRFVAEAMGRLPQVAGTPRSDGGEFTLHKQVEAVMRRRAHAAHTGEGIDMASDTL